MTAIVVLGIHRGGTSAVAGVLHHLGIHMGDDLLPPSKHNPKGYFEDQEFVDIHNLILGDWRDPQVNFEPYREAYTTMIRERERQHELWGIKDPRMCFVFPYFAEIAHDVHVISVGRDPDDCAESLFARGGHTLEEATKISSHYLGQKWLTVSRFHGPVLKVRYDHLIDCPESIVLGIAYFVGPGSTQEAIDFIDPTLCHHRRQLGGPQCS